MKVVVASAVWVISAVAMVLISTVIGEGYYWTSLGLAFVLFLVFVPGKRYYLAAVCGILLFMQYTSSISLFLSMITLSAVAMFVLCLFFMGGITQEAAIPEEQTGFIVLVYVVTCAAFLLAALLPENRSQAAIKEAAATVRYASLSSLVRSLYSSFRSPVDAPASSSPLQVVHRQSQAINSPTPQDGGFVKSNVLPSSQIADMKQRIERWKASKEKLSVLVASLQKDRQDLLRRLGENGVKSVDDASTNPRAKVLLEELRDVLRQLTLYQKKQDDYDLAVFKSESQLRTLERRILAKEAGISDAELLDLTKSMLSLEESLSSDDESAVPLALDDMLVKEVASVGAQMRSSVPEKPAK